MSRGKRFDAEPKLNIKKVFAVIIAMLVIVMFIFGIKELLKDKDNSTIQKTFAIGYYTVNENGKWGVIDTNQNMVLSPTYEEMIIIPDNTKPVFITTLNSNYETGTFDTKVLDNKKKELFTDYDRVEVIYNQDKSNNLWYEKNVLKVKKGEKFGLIDLDGKEICPCEYDEIKPIIGAKNILVTVKDGMQGVINTTGTILVKNEYIQISTITSKYEDGFVIKNEDNRYGIVNSTGELVVEPKYDEVKDVAGNKMYVVKDMTTWKIVDEKGNEYLAGEFEDIKELNLGNAIISKGGKYGIVSTSGEVKVDYEYDNLDFIYTDTYIAKKDNKYGIIGVDGTIKLPFNYTSIKYEEEADFIRAQKEDMQTDLMDRDFKVKTEGIVSEINTDKNYIRVRVEDDYKYYNFKLEEKDSKDVLISNTLFLKKENGKYGFVDSNGVVIVNYIYDDATEQNKYGFAAVKKNGKWGCIDSKGKVIVDPKYTLENNLIIDFIGDWHLAEDINAFYYTR